MNHRIFDSSGRRNRHWLTGAAAFALAAAFLGGFQSAAQTQSPARGAAADFNGDRKTDFAVWRSIDNKLFWFNAINGTNETRVVQWGATGGPFDFPVPEDFDGDGRDDIAVYRPFASGSFFFILQSSTGTMRAVQFGKLGDSPNLSADYDGDGKSDIAVFRGGAGGSTVPSYFYYLSSANQERLVTVQWGQGSDKPARGDFDGDGKHDFAVFRSPALPNQGQAMFYALQSRDGFYAVPWGVSNDQYAPGDYDGDGRDDVSVVRSTGGRKYFYVLTRTNQLIYYDLGLSTDWVTPGDYTGDGKTDAAIWRPENGTFYVRPAGTTGSADYAVQWGQNGDQPLAAYQNR